MSEPFDGIAEKLQRSNENIRNLEIEIARFFQDSKYPILSNDNQQVIPEALEYHNNCPVPLRFSVLSGEIIRPPPEIVPRSHHLATLQFRIQNEE